METNTNTAAVITVNTRGADLKVLTAATVDAWRALYSFSVCQVWTWRGGEAIIACDHSANYGRGEYRAIVRTGGTKRGTVRVIWCTSFANAMESLGISYRISTGFRPRRERTRTELMRAQLAIAARRNGNTYRTIRARSSSSLAA